MTKERRTPRSKYGQRGYKGPKWLADLLSPNTFKDTDAARGYSGGLSSIKRILHDIFNNDEE